MGRGSVLRLQGQDRLWPTTLPSFTCHRASVSGIFEIMFCRLVLLGFDPLKAEMGSLRELGSSRESSMQRGASLDVSYDERDISRVCCYQRRNNKFISGDVFPH